MILGWNFDAQTGGLEKQKQAFRIFLLQFKRFRWIMKFDEKWIPKGYPTSTKIGAAGAQGLDFYDLGRFLEAPTFLVFFGAAKKSANNPEQIEIWFQNKNNGYLCCQHANSL